MRYLWEVVGTFAVFYLINFESTYPSLLVHIALLYEVPLLIAAILILVRNATLAYSTFIGDKKREREFHVLYVVSTLLAAFFVTGILTSALTGTGVNLTNNILNLSLMLFNPFNIMLFLGIVLLSVFIAGGYLQIGKHQSRSIITGLLPGLAVLLLAVYVYVPTIIKNLGADPFIIAFEAVLLIATIAVNIYKSKYAGYASTAFLLGSIMVFGVLSYPYMFGGSINMLLQITTSAAIGGAVLLVTIVGYIMLIAAFVMMKLFGARGEKDAY